MTTRSDVTNLLLPSIAVKSLNETNNWVQVLSMQKLTLNYDCECGSIPTSECYFKSLFVLSEQRVVSSSQVSPYFSFSVCLLVSWSFNLLINVWYLLECAVQSLSKTGSGLWTRGEWVYADIWWFCDGLSAIWRILWEKRTKSWEVKPKEGWSVSMIMF